MGSMKNSVRLYNKYENCFAFFSALLFSCFSHCYDSVMVIWYMMSSFNIILYIVDVLRE